MIIFFVTVRHRTSITTSVKSLQNL